MSTKAKKYYEEDVVETRKRGKNREKDHEEGIVEKGKSVGKTAVKGMVLGSVFLITAAAGLAGCTVVSESYKTAKGELEPIEIRKKKGMFRKEEVTYVNSYTGRNVSGECVHQIKMGKIQPREIIKIK